MRPVAMPADPVDVRGERGRCGIDGGQVLSQSERKKRKVKVEAGKRDVCLGERARRRRCYCFFNGKCRSSVYGWKGRLQGWKRADGKERAASTTSLHRAGTTYRVPASTCGGARGLSVHVHDDDDDGRRMMFGTSTKVQLPALDYCSSIGCSPTGAFTPWFSWLS